MLACVALLAFAGGADAAGMGVDPGQRLRLSPEQRRDMWERMSPEQREAWRNARSSEDRQRAWQNFSPDQRRDMWERLSPEQREMMLRRLPPEQRQDMWRNMTPDQRQAMRQRFLEQRPVEPGGGPPPRPPHQDGAGSRLAYTPRSHAFSVEHGVCGHLDPDQVQARCAHHASDAHGPLSVLAAAIIPGRRIRRRVERRA